MTDTSYLNGDRHPPVIVDQRWLDGFFIVTWQFAADEFTAAVHPLGAAPAYFGLGETAKAARLMAWQWITDVQRRVTERKGMNEMGQAA